MKAGLDLPLFSMGSNFGDLDNDGYPDFYLATGEPDLRSIIPNRMFHNDGHGRFKDVTTAGGFGHLQKGHGVAFGDLDNDGDQDLYVNLGGAFEGDGYQNALFENPGMGNHWTTLFLQGTRSARSAIHARIRVTVRTPKGERDIHAMVGTGGSFGSSSLQQEIGLGDALSIAQVEVTWPATHQKQVFVDPPMDRQLKLVEGDPVAAELSLPVLHWQLGQPGSAHQHHHMN